MSTRIQRWHQCIFSSHLWRPADTVININEMFLRRFWNEWAKKDSEGRRRRADSLQENENWNATRKYTVPSLPLNAEYNSLRPYDDLNYMQGPIYEETNGEYILTFTNLDLPLGLVKDIAKCVLAFSFLYPLATPQLTTKTWFRLIIQDEIGCVLKT